MATDTASVNGMYDTQFSQPAELAASTPSHAASASQSSTAAGGQSQKADPQEIGWYFVEQYYTTLSKSPERIHLFYSKKSQLVTGQEAEKVLPSVGTKAISEKIKSLDIQDCKVRVLNVDSQSSYDNIVVQVIGEMSNKSEPHHKFVQTFILATQPNGYFVLNDIFRYLNDEEDEIIEDEPVQEEVHEEQEAPPVEVPVEIPAHQETVTTDEAVHEVDEKLEEAKEESTTSNTNLNGVDDSVAPEPSVSDIAEVKDTTSEAIESIPGEQPAEPETTPAQTSPKIAPVSDGPQAKKTWASMVGTKAPAIPALPQAAASVPTPTPTSSQPKPQRSAQPAQATKPAAPAAGDADSASQSNGWQTADHGKKARGQQAKGAEAIVHAYIKNVTDKIDARVLREVLEKFGDLKYYDVSRPKQSAFVEFADPAGYAAAVAANPHTVGTEQINVEERRPRPGQFGGNNTQFGRGGSNAGRARGGMQQRSGSQGNNVTRDSGRGGFQQRGKSGNVTPKGRGQTQAT